MARPVNVAKYNTANQKLLHPKGEPLRHIPIKIYMPAVPEVDAKGNTKQGKIKVIQTLVTPTLPTRNYGPMLCGSTAMLITDRPAADVGHRPQHDNPGSI